MMSTTLAPVAMMITIGAWCGAFGGLAGQLPGTPDELRSHLISVFGEGSPQALQLHPDKMSDARLIELVALFETEMLKKIRKDRDGKITPDTISFREYMSRKVDEEYTEDKKAWEEQ